MIYVANSIVWAVTMVACAVLLKGEDAFLGVLLVLILGAVGSDGVIRWTEKREPRPG